MKWSLLIPSIVSLLYCIAVIFIAASERSSGGGGGFITLPGIITALATLPGTALIEAFGKFDFQSNLHVAFAMLVTAALLFGIVFGALKLFRVQ